MDIFKINQLPEVLVGEILSFIPLSLLSITNKNSWENYYKIRLNTSKNNLISKTTYWRFLLRYDMDYLFSKYLEYYFPIFIKNKKLIYQYKIFPRKVELIQYLSTFIFESHKCKVILQEFMTKNGLVFKKIKTRCNKWTN